MIIRKKCRESFAESSFWIAVVYLILFFTSSTCITLYQFHGVLGKLAKILPKFYNVMTGKLELLRIFLNTIFLQYIVIVLLCFTLLFFKICNPEI